MSRPAPRDFAEALRLLKEGRAVRRRRWRGLPMLPAYLCLPPSDPARILACWRKPSERARRWEPWDDDLLATDWEPVTASEMF